MEVSEIREKEARVCRKSMGREWKLGEEIQEKLRKSRGKAKWGNGENGGKEEEIEEVREN